MNRRRLIALSILAAVGSNAAFAYEGAEGYLRLKPFTTTNQAPAFSSGTRVAAPRVADPHAAYLRLQGIDLRPAKSQVSREEVLAELQIWRESGLADLERGESGTDPHSEQYQHAAAKYTALRNAPEFADRVEQIARQRGSAVVVVGR